MDLSTPLLLWDICFYGDRAHFRCLLLLLLFQGLVGLSIPSRAPRSKLKFYDKTSAHLQIKASSSRRRLAVAVRYTRLLYSSQSFPWLDRVAKNPPKLTQFHPTTSNINSLLFIAPWIWGGSTPPTGWWLRSRSSVENCSNFFLLHVWHQLTLFYG